MQPPSTAAAANQTGSPAERLHPASPVGSTIGPSIPAASMPLLTAGHAWPRAELTSARPTFDVPWSALQSPPHGSAPAGRAKAEPWELRRATCRAGACRRPPRGAYTWMWGDPSGWAEGRRSFIAVCFRHLVAGAGRQHPLESRCVVIGRWRSAVSGSGRDPGRLAQESRSNNFPAVTRSEPRDCCIKASWEFAARDPCLPPATSGPASRSVRCGQGNWPAPAGGTSVPSAALSGARTPAARPHLICNAAAHFPGTADSHRCPLRPPRCWPWAPGAQGLWHLEGSMQALTKRPGARGSTAAAGSRARHESAAAAKQFPAGTSRARSGAGRSTGCRDLICTAPPAGPGALLGRPCRGVHDGAGFSDPSGALVLYRPRSPAAPFRGLSAHLQWTHRAAHVCVHSRRDGRAPAGRPTVIAMCLQTPAAPGDVTKAPPIRPATEALAEIQRAGQHPSACGRTLPPHRAGHRRGLLPNWQQERPLARRRLAKTPVPLRPLRLPASPPAGFWLCGDGKSTPGEGNRQAEPLRAEGPAATAARAGLTWRGLIAAGP